MVFGSEWGSEWKSGWSTEANGRSRMVAKANDKNKPCLRAYHCLIICHPLSFLRLSGGPDLKVNSKVNSKVNRVDVLRKHK